MNNMYDILDKMKLLEGKGSKPDFLDLDKDGDKTEPMKKAAKEKKVDEAVEEVAEGDVNEAASKTARMARIAKACARDAFSNIDRKMFLKAAELFAAGDEQRGLDAIRRMDTEASDDFYMGCDEAGIPVPMDESALQAYLGKKKYGEAGMKALQKAGREDASKEKMARIRAQHDKMDEADVGEGNDFTGARLAAIKAGKPTFSVGGKTYKVTGDTSDEKVMEKKQKTLWPGTPEYKAKFGDEMRTGEKRKSSTGGEIEKTASGVKHTRSYDDDEGEDKKADDSAPKKRGRPKGKAKGPERVTAKAWKHKGGRVKEGMEDDELQTRVNRLHWASSLKDKLDPEGKRTKFVPGRTDTPYRVTSGSVAPDEIKRQIKRQQEKGGITGPRGPLPEDEEMISLVDKGEYDREGDMAREQLHTVMDAAKELHSILDADDNLPEWVQSKITKALDYLDTARDYVKASDAEDGEGQPMVAEKFASQAQARLMHATAGGADTGVSKKTAKEFIKKSHGQKVGDLPEKVKKDEAVEETTTSGSVATSDEAPKSKGKKGMIFGKGVYEGYEQQFNQLLTEGMSINMSVGEDGTKSLSVNATDEDAVKLAQILKLAGMEQAGGYQEACSTCGQAPCGCESLEEADYANSPEETGADINTLVNTYSDGLDGQKTTGQTTIPVIAGQTQRMMSQVKEQAEQRLWDLYKQYESK